MTSVQLDDLDRLAAGAFEGFIVKKDLLQRFKGRYPVPTYVGEFLLGRYCATIDEGEIVEGLEIVQRLLAERTVRAGEEELFKSRAREQGSVRLLDIITAKLDTRTNSYVATLPSLQLPDVGIEDDVVRNNDRMLTGGFYAEITVEYEPMDPRPFRVAGLRPIQLSTRGALDTLAAGRSGFTSEQWRQFLLRSIGFEPDLLDQRARDVLLLRMVPFVVRNYNMVEIGPRGTGKSHLFQQVSPYAHLVSGGKATVARMFVNNATGQRGLVAQYDVVCFDEVSGVSFDQKDGVNIMKGYMESGEFSRGRESIRAEGSIVLVGNFDIDVFTQLRKGHLFQPLPPEMRDDTAFMDRIHAYLPGWDVPKLHPSLFTTHFGLVSDFLSECWSRLRTHSRLPTIEGRLHLGPALSGRDRSAVLRTVDGLLKLLYPDPDTAIEPEDLAWAARLALESRRRVKEQQARIGPEEFREVELGFEADGGAAEVVTTPERALAANAGAESRAPRWSQPRQPPVEAPHADVFKPGDVVGTFEILEPLGRGGFSRVYRVYRPIDDREYALKVFTSRRGFEPVRRELSFLREIDHPHVVKVVWADELDDGRWYLVTELVEGEPLEDWVGGAKRLSLVEALEVGRQLLSALEAIHPHEGRIADLESKPEVSAAEFDELQELKSAGVVHRDIKPANLLLTDHGVVLIDFNIASRAGDQVVTVSGTPPYQPPDIGYAAWDVSVDLFAAGVTIYELVCGTHPYEDDEPRRDRKPRDPRDFVPDLAVPVVEFLMRSCAPDKAQRFRTASAMLAALNEAMRTVPQF